MFKSIGDFFGSVFKGIGDFLMAHPVVKNLAGGLVTATTTAALGYVGAATDPAHASAFTGAGLGLAVLGAAKAYAQNQHDKILANLQDQLQNLASTAQGTRAFPTSVPAVAVAQTPAVNSSALTPIPAPSVASPVKP